MNIKPLSKEIYNKAKELGVEQIVLRFSGGSDEGYLDVELCEADKVDDSFFKEVEDWAWEVYNYSGAGDGSDYGDDVTYDLKNGKASTSEWYMSRSAGGSNERNLQIEA